MAKEYQTSVLELEDGRVVTGILKTEDSKSVNGTNRRSIALVIPKDEIADLEVEPPIDDAPKIGCGGFRIKELRSLVAYHAPIAANHRFLATTENAAERFSTASRSTGWSGEEGLWRVENGEIIGSALHGLKENEFLVSDLGGRRFPLTA